MCSMGLSPHTARIHVCPFPSKHLSSVRSSIAQTLRISRGFLVRCRAVAATRALHEEPLALFSGGSCGFVWCMASNYWDSLVDREEVVSVGNVLNKGPNEGSEVNPRI